MGRIVAVVLGHGGQHRGVIGVEVEPFLSRVAGDVREEKPRREEERFIVRHIFQLLDGSGSDVVIAFFRVVIVVRPDAPVHEGVIAERGIGDELCGRFRTDASRGAPVLKFRVFSIGGLRADAVVDFPVAVAFVAVGDEMLGKGDVVSPLGDVAKPGFQSVNPGRAGPQSEHEARP